MSKNVRKAQVVEAVNYARYIPSLNVFTLSIWSSLAFSPALTNCKFPFLHCGFLDFITVYWPQLQVQSTSFSFYFLNSFLN